MRLLSVHSVIEGRLPVFHELLENGLHSPLCYAILSHTWGTNQECKDIVFNDIPSSETTAKFLDEKAQLKKWQGEIGKKKAGFSKMTHACRTARGMGLDYIWIDSCCIDVSNSAELNESINSMYRWYKNSDRCIAYLEDLEPDGSLRQCKWFKRGWTLQELVAPSKVMFFDKMWNYFGERSDRDLCETLSHITGIDTTYLHDEADPGPLSTAHKMSWAAGRETTRPEDRAYSLMGIFDVNMPLIYGEGGTKAFRRLQEEICKTSSDLSIFAWDPSVQANTTLELFASRPDDFTVFKDMVPSYQSQHFTTTNKGIKMKTILWRMRCDDGKDRLMLALGKQKKGKSDIGIILRKVGHNMFMRRGCLRPFTDEKTVFSTRRSTFYLVSRSDGSGYNHVLKTSRSHAILMPTNGSGNFYVQNPAPEYAWDCEDMLFFNNPHWSGSDWRAIEIVDKAQRSVNNQRFVALFSLEDAPPQCYIIRWNKQLAVMFDRRHQTETTRLNEFRDAIDGATNEVQIEGTGAKLSIQLIPTIIDENAGTQFRVELQKVPRFVLELFASVPPTAAYTPVFDPHTFEHDFANSYIDTCQSFGPFPQVETTLFHRSQKRVKPEDSVMGRIFAHHRGTGVSFQESPGSTAFAALSATTQGRICDSQSQDLNEGSKKRRLLHHDGT